MGKAQSVGLAAALAFGAATQAQAGPFTRSEIASLTYEQVKGTGLANTCPTVEGGGKTSIKLNGKNKIDEFCLEPTTFQVLEDKLTKAGVVTEAVNTKVTTRQTYVLTGIEGDLIPKDGKLTFIEKDGIDYAPTTVQLPGGERVPFLFTVKNLVASSWPATSRSRRTAPVCSSTPRAVAPPPVTIRPSRFRRCRLAATSRSSTRTTRSSTCWADLSSSR